MNKQQTELERMIDEFIQNHCIFTEHTHPMKTAFIEELKAILDKAFKEQAEIDAHICDKLREENGTKIHGIPYRTWMPCILLFVIYNNDCGGNSCRNNCL